MLWNGWLKVSVEENDYNTTTYHCMCSRAAFYRLWATRSSANHAGSFRRPMGGSNATDIYLQRDFTHLKTPFFKWWLQLLGWHHFPGSAVTAAFAFITSWWWKKKVRTRQLEKCLYLPSVQINGCMFLWELDWNFSMPAVALLDNSAAFTWMSLLITKR